MKKLTNLKENEYHTPVTEVTWMVSEGVLCASGDFSNPNSIPDMQEDVLGW